MLAPNPCPLRSCFFTSGRTVHQTPCCNQATPAWYFQQLSIALLCSRTPGLLFLSLLSSDHLKHLGMVAHQAEAGKVDAGLWRRACSSSLRSRWFRLGCSSGLRHSEGLPTGNLNSASRSKLDTLTEDRFICTQNSTAFNSHSEPGVLSAIVFEDLVHSSSSLCTHGTIPLTHLHPVDSPAHAAPR